MRQSVGNDVSDPQRTRLAPFATISGGGRFVDLAHKALIISGIKVGPGPDIADALSAVPVSRTALCIVSIAGVDANDAERWCSACAIIAPGMGKRMILVLTRAQIDLAGAHLLGSGAQLLCEPDTADFTAALRLAFPG